jgi:hypothetical protein
MSNLFCLDLLHYGVLLKARHLAGQYGDGKVLVEFWRDSLHAYNRSGKVLLWGTLLYCTGDSVLYFGHCTVLYCTGDAVLYWRHCTKLYLGHCDLLYFRRCTVLYWIHCTVLNKLLYLGHCTVLGTLGSQSVHNTVFLIHSRHQHASIPVEISDPSTQANRSSRRCVRKKDSAGFDLQHLL